MRRLAVAALSLCAAAAVAQTPDDLRLDGSDDPVALIADEVIYDERAGVLIARGDVEVYQGARVLRASEITYDAATGAIDAVGPIAIDDGAGTVLVAEAAALDAELRDGVVAGARALIADGAGAAAAVETQRIDGRYTLMSRAVYSSCEVCVDKPTPLWRIRARRVLHDAETRDVHYEDATFDVLGTPVAYLPYFRHPDPGVRRRTGFLVPEISSATTYGLGLQVPYFIVIDDSRDVTLTPFLTTDDGPILSGQYRQAFDNGAIDLGGSFGVLDIDDGDGFRGRGHIDAEGGFDLDLFPDEPAFGLDPLTQAGFSVQLTTDEGYLRRYDFDGSDRLTSEAFLENYGRRDFATVAGVFFQSLRDNEPTDEIPIALPEFSLRRAFDGAFWQGDVGLTASGVVLTRVDGRDVARVSVGADWERSGVLPAGFTLRGFASMRADGYRIGNDPGRADRTEYRLAPLAGLDLRWPLARADAAATHLIEPAAQVILAPEDLNDDIPNEDSLLVEFDETNLFDVNRFSGFDRVEPGPRVNLGVRYARAPVSDGVAVDAALGRVFRLGEESDFSDASGLSDRASDYVAAWSVRVDDTVRLANRVRVDDDFSLARNEIAAAYAGDRVKVDLGYVFLADDSTAGAEADREEAFVDAALALDRQWSLGGAMRRDIEEARFVDVEARLVYRSECAAIEAFVGRDFTTSRDNPASTRLGVRVELFGAGDGAGARSGLCDVR